MMIHTKKIRSKSITVTPFLNDEECCYTWSNGGARRLADGTTNINYVCSGCRSIKDKKKVTTFSCPAEKHNVWF